MASRLRSTAGIVVSTLLAASLARATPLVDGADRGPAEAALSDRAAGYARQQRSLSAVELGVPLPAMVKGPFLLEVKRFFADPNAQDLLQSAGIFPFEAIERYVGYEDMALTGGFAAVDAASRLALARAGGSPAEIAEARARAVTLARTWHLLASAGGSGVLARGVRLGKARAGEPDPPGVPPLLVPLRDERGSVLPTRKVPTWRAAIDATAGDTRWMDDAGLAHYAGWALGAVSLWDALVDDLEVPNRVTDDLEADAAQIGRALRVVAPELGLDLALRDADGRLTDDRALNARVSADGRVLGESDTLDGARAAIALAVVRAAYHLTGDAELGRFYYEDLVGRRDYAGAMTRGAGRAFTGPSTDYAMVAALSVALYTLGRIETDGALRDALSRTLDAQFWSASDERAARALRQAWFDVVYASFATNKPGDLSARLQASLGGFQGAPAFQRDRVNCDASEIASGDCVALDGTTHLPLDPRRGPAGRVLARDVVPMALRPDSAFEWADDPFRVNGTGDLRINPGVDYTAAYFTARANDLDPSKNVTGHPRAALPYAIAPAPPPTTTPPASTRIEAGGCSTAGLGGGEAIAGLAALALVLAAIRTSRGGAGASPSSRRGPSSPPRR